MVQVAHCVRVREDDLGKLLLLHACMHICMLARTFSVSAHMAVFLDHFWTWVRNTAPWTCCTCMYTLLSVIFTYKCYVCMYVCMYVLPPKRWQMNRIETFPGIIRGPSPKSLSNEHIESSNLTRKYFVYEKCMYVYMWRPFHAELETCAKWDAEARWTALLMEQWYVSYEYLYST